MSKLNATLAISPSGCWIDMLVGAANESQGVASKAGQSNFVQQAAFLGFQVLYSPQGQNVRVEYQGIGPVITLKQSLGGAETLLMGEALANCYAIFVVSVHLRNPPMISILPFSK